MFHSYLKINISQTVLILFFSASFSCVPYLCESIFIHPDIQNHWVILNLQFDY